MTYRTFGSGLGVFHCAQSRHSLAADHGTGAGDLVTTQLLPTGDSHGRKIEASSVKEEMAASSHRLKSLTALNKIKH